jgi:hypothetical protein
MEYLQTRATGSQISVQEFPRASHKPLRWNSPERKMIPHSSRTRTNGRTSSAFRGVLILRSWGASRAVLMVETSDWTNAPKLRAAPATTALSCAQACCSLLFLNSAGHFLSRMYDGRTRM